MYLYVYFRHLNASSELYVRLEECFEQLHLLEKEEKHVSNLFCYTMFLTCED